MYVMCIYIYRYDLVEPLGISVVVVTFWGIFCFFHSFEQIDIHVYFICVNIYINKL